MTTFEVKRLKALYQHQHQIYTIVQTEHLNNEKPRQMAGLKIIRGALF